MKGLQDAKAVLAGADPKAGFMTTKVRAAHGTGAPERVVVQPLPVHLLALDVLGRCSRCMGSAQRVSGGRHRVLNCPWCLLGSLHRLWDGPAQVLAFLRTV